MSDEAPDATTSRPRPADWEKRVPAEGMRQFPRFLVVGVGNTVLSFSSYWLLIEAGMTYVIAAPISFAVGAVNGYVFNRRWTFAARDSTRARLLYVTIQVGAAAFTTLFVYFLVRVVGLGSIGAYVIAIPIATVCSFSANRLWTFADRD